MHNDENEQNTASIVDDTWYASINLDPSVFVYHGGFLEDGSFLEDVELEQAEIAPMEDVFSNPYGGSYISKESFMSLFRERLPTSMYCEFKRISNIKCRVRDRKTVYFVYRDFIYMKLDLSSSHITLYLLGDGDYSANVSNKNLVKAINKTLESLKRPERVFWQNRNRLVQLGDGSVIFWSNKYKYFSV